MDLRFLCVSFLLSAALSHASCSPSSGAAYFVSNIKSFSVGDGVDYEMRTPSQFSSHLLSSIAAASEAGVPNPKALLVLLSEPAHADPLAVSVVGSSDSTRIMPVSKDESIAAIKKALEVAPSSTVFTSIGHSCEGPSLREALMAEAASRNEFASGVRLGGACAKDHSETLQAFLQTWAAEAAAHSVEHKMALLLFCLPADQLGPANTPGSALLQAYSVLENTTSQFAALLVPELAPAGKATCSRSLLVAHPPPAFNGTCDATCRTKATLLEALFVALVMIIALVSGLCCLADLDSPTRFETPPDST